MSTARRSENTCATMMTMATGVLVSVKDYLRTSYRPDCDYLDGEVTARNLGEFEHSSAQREILLFLAAHYPHLRRRLLPEQRVQVRADRYRIPDICIVAAEALQQKIITTPPDLCIEILSPEDTLTKTMDRIGDYFAMGVPTVLDCRPCEPPGAGSQLPAIWMRLALDAVLRARSIEMPLAEVLD